MTRPANSLLSARSDRIAGAWGLNPCLPPPPGGQVRTAPDAPPPASGADHFISRGDDSLPRSTVSGADTAGTVTLSDASAFILSLIAAHEGRPADDIVTELITAAAEAIGIHSLILRDAGEVDLAEVPGFARRAANRFRSYGP